MECWSNDLMNDIPLFNTPLLHHSRAETFKIFNKFKFIFLFVIVSINFP